MRIARRGRSFPRRASCASWPRTQSLVDLRGTHRGQGVLEGLRLRLRVRLLRRREPLLHRLILHRLGLHLQVWVRQVPVLTMDRSRLSMGPRGWVPP